MDRTGRADAEQFNALLIDDNSSTFAAHLASLNALGYHVIKASDPTAALSVAKTAAPRVIFLSIGARGLGAAPFLTALRSNDNTRHIPVRILPSTGDHRLESLKLRKVGREHW